MVLRNPRTNRRNDYLEVIMRQFLIPTCRVGELSPSYPENPRPAGWPAYHNNSCFLLIIHLHDDFSQLWPHERLPIPELKWRRIRTDVPAKSSASHSDIRLYNQCVLRLVGSFFLVATLTPRCGSAAGKATFAFSKNLCTDARGCGMQLHFGCP